MQLPYSVPCAECRLDEEDGNCSHARLYLPNQGPVLLDTVAAAAAAPLAAAFASSQNHTAAALLIAVAVAAASAGVGVEGRHVKGQVLHRQARLSGSCGRPAGSTAGTIQRQQYSIAVVQHD